MQRFAELVVVVVLLVAALPTLGQNKPILAVMEIEDKTKELQPALVTTLSELLRTAVAARRDVIVIDKTRQADELQLLSESLRRESHKPCYDDSCQIPLGRRLSADKLLRARVVRLGSSYRLSCELIGLAEEAIVAAVEVETPVKPANTLEDRLADALSELARRIPAGGRIEADTTETAPVEIGVPGGDGVRVSPAESGKRGSHGIVTVESTPSGAAVSIDGKPTSQKTPAEVFVRTGEHRVEVSGLQGYRPKEVVLQTHGGQKIRFHLEPITGALVVVPKDKSGRIVKGAIAYIDGQERGIVPARFSNVRVGERLLQIGGAGFGSLPKRAAVREGEEEEITIDMIPCDEIRLHALMKTLYYVVDLAPIVRSLTHVAPYRWLLSVPWWLEGIAIDGLAYAGYFAVTEADSTGWRVFGWTAMITGYIGLPVLDYFWFKKLEKQRKKKHKCAAGRKAPATESPASDDVRVRLVPALLGKEGAGVLLDLRFR